MPDDAATTPTPPPTTTPDDGAERVGVAACPRCGYDLHGLPLTHQCPECGWDYDMSSVLLDGRPYFAQTPLGFAMIFIGWAAMSLANGWWFITPLLLLPALWFGSIAARQWWNRRGTGRASWQLYLDRRGISLTAGPGEPTIIPWTTYRVVQMHRHWPWKLTRTERVQPLRRLVISQSQLNRWGFALAGGHPFGRSSERRHIDFLFTGTTAEGARVENAARQFMRQAHREAYGNAQPPTPTPPGRPGRQRSAD